MIVPEKSTLAAFVREGWQSGFRALCAERSAKAVKQLKEANPMEAMRIKELQAEIQFWEKGIPSVVDAVNEFVAQQAITPK